MNTVPGEHVRGPRLRARTRSATSQIGRVGLLVSIGIAVVVLFTNGMASHMIARATAVEGAPVQLDGATEFSLYRPPYSPTTGCVMRAPDGSAIPLDGSSVFAISRGSSAWYYGGTFTTTETGEYSLDCGDDADDPTRRYRISEGDPPWYVPPTPPFTLIPVFIVGTISAVMLRVGRYRDRRATRLPHVGPE